MDYPWAAITKGKAAYSTALVSDTAAVVVWSSHDTWQNAVLLLHKASSHKYYYLRSQGRSTSTRKRLPVSYLLYRVGSFLTKVTGTKFWSNTELRRGHAKQCNAVVVALGGSNCSRAMQIVKAFAAVEPAIFSYILHPNDVTWIDISTGGYYTER
jgi:hypothetical protein